MAIRCLKDNTLLNTKDQALYLNGVLHVCPASFSCCQLQDELTIHLSGLPLEYLVSDIGGMEKELLHTFTSSFATSLTTPPVVITQSTLFECTTTIMKTLELKLQNGNWNARKMQENSACVNAFYLFTGTFIGSVPYTNFNGSTYELPESKSRKQQLATQLGTSEKHIKGRKPDRSISISIDNNLYHVLLCEIKTESAAKVGGDLVKLGLMKKDCLDKILSDGYPRDLQYVVGVPQEKQKCTLYVMNSTFDRYYQMINVYSSTMPSSKDYMSHLYETITLLSYVRCLVDTAVSSAERRLARQ